MQFNYKNNPILAMYDSGRLNAMIPSFDKDMVDILMPALNEIWKEMVPNCRKEIYYLTDTFIKEMETKVLLWSDCVKEDIQHPSFELFANGCATFITKRFTNCFFADTKREIFCNLEFVNWEDNLILRSIVLNHAGSFYSGENKIAWTTRTDNAPEHSTKEAINVFSQVLAGYYFIKNVKTRTKILLPPKKKTKLSKDEKHINDTLHPIQILDARWYTEIIQPNPFFVKNYDRKQRYGPGFSQIKEITIEGFWKHGYTSQAMKNRLRKKDNVES